MMIMKGFKTLTKFENMDSIAVASLSYIRQRNMPSGWIEENYPDKWPFTVVDIIKSGDLSTFNDTELGSIQNLKEALSKDQWDNLKLIFLDYSTHLDFEKRERERAIAEAVVKKKEERIAATEAQQAEQRERLRIKEMRMGFDAFTYEDKKFETTNTKAYDFNSYLVDDEIQRHKEQLGVERVVVSTGSRAQTFHIDGNCRWMWSGRVKSSRYSDLPDIAEVSVEEAVRILRRRPCDSCFDFWWRGDPKVPLFNDQLTVPKYEFKIHDRVLILDGPFNSLVGVITNELPGRLNVFRVIISIFGRETPIEISASALKPIE